MQHVYHDPTLSAGLAADCPRCRQIVANGEDTSPGFDDRATDTRRAAAHMPDTVTRVHPSADGGYLIRIGYTVTPDDITGIIESAQDIAGHWAANIRREPDGAVIITERGEGDYGPNGHSAHVVTPRDIAGAIAGILDGSHPCDPDIIRNLREYVAALDYCDAETGDAVLQIAALGDITYG